jgi:translation initiation factor 1
MASSNRKYSDAKPSASEHFVYREFGDNPAAVERAVPELPVSQQNLRVQASRKGRKGKTVTVITGFQAKPETLVGLLKQMKHSAALVAQLRKTKLKFRATIKRSFYRF